MNTNYKLINFKIDVNGLIFFIFIIKYYFHIKTIIMKLFENL